MNIGVIEETMLAKKYKNFSATKSNLTVQPNISPCNLCCTTISKLRFLGVGAQESQKLVQIFYSSHNNSINNSSPVTNNIQTYRTRLENMIRFVVKRVF